MSIVVKEIGRKKYVYTAARENGKTVHRYIGAIDDPKSNALMRAAAERNRLPRRFHPYFWDTNAEKIKPKKHGRYVAERLLELGRMDAVEWLQKIHPAGFLIEVCETSRKISEQSKNFWRIWFGGGRAS